MSLIKCPECGKEISDKSNVCVGCGFPVGEYLGRSSDSSFSCAKKELNFVLEDLLDELYKSENGKKVMMIKKVQEITGRSLSEAKEIVNDYFASKFPEKKLYYTKKEEIKKNISEPKKEKQIFNGIYRYENSKKEEVYCPRCGSENCSYYTEQTQSQKSTPAKTKTRYTVNLNPFRPLTIVNKKEKVVKKEKVKTKVKTEQKIICNSCGFTFE